MVDAAIRLLSLANQLASTTRRVRLNFEEGSLHQQRERPERPRIELLEPRSRPAHPRRGVYIQGPGFGVGIGRPAYRERYYDRGYRDYRGGYAYSGKRYLHGPGIYPRHSNRWRDRDWD